jgi:hypothetical protein
VVLAIILAACLSVNIIKRNRRRKFGLVLYFIAGWCSISLELITFYLYQTSAGSLYSELSFLIGIFMLGLAAGTYLSVKFYRENMEFPALLMMLSATILLFATYEKISVGAHLYYYGLFLLTIALSTGSLFVAASDRYYYGKANANRGLGYAVEIFGSSLGALTITTILLPILGLYWLLIAMVILLGLILMGAMLIPR